MRNNSQIGNSLTIVAILTGLVAVLGVAGFFVWNKMQSESSLQNNYTPPPRSTTNKSVSKDKAMEDVTVPEAKTSTDLDKYSTELDKLNVDSLDEGN